MENNTPERPKHFNVSHIWGTILSIKADRTTTGRPYADIRIDCDSSKYGPVQTTVRVWGKDKARRIPENFKTGDTVKVKGLMGQFNGREEGVVRTNFVGLYVDAWDPETGKHKHSRAVFILQGSVKETELKDDGMDLIVALLIVGRGDYQDSETDFKIHIPNDILLDQHSPSIGETVYLKGAIVREEDEFGEVERYGDPVASETRLINEEVPF